MFYRGGALENYEFEYRQNNISRNSFRHFRPIIKILLILQKFHFEDTSTITEAIEYFTNGKGGANSFGHENLNIVVYDYYHFFGVFGYQDSYSKIKIHLFLMNSFFKVGRC